MAHQIDLQYGMWSNRQIRDYYDLNPDITILTYAGMLGLTGTELKDILMTDGSAIDKEEEKTAQLMFEEADQMFGSDEGEEGMYCTPYDPETDTEPTETRTEYCYRMGFDM